MTKKIWRLLCILSAVFAGILLYAGVVLVFQHASAREGIYAWIAGISAVAFFGVALFRSGKQSEKVHMILTEGAAVLLAVGGTLYLYRNYAIGVQLRVTGVVLFWAIVFLWYSLLSKKSKRLRENELQEQLLQFFSNEEKAKTQAEDVELEKEAGKIYALKREIWVLRWCIGILSLPFIAGLMQNFRQEWKSWVVALLVAIVFAWVAGNDDKYLARNLPEWAAKQKNEKIVRFFVLYYRRAEKYWESLSPMVQIYLPIALCQMKEYDHALQLLQCIKKRPDEEAYYLVWEAEAWKGKEDWNALKETIERLKKAIPYLAKNRKAEIEEKQRAYERIWREKGK